MGRLGVGVIGELSPWRCHRLPHGDAVAYGRCPWQNQVQDKQPQGVDAMNASDQILFDKIKQLPPQRVAEVEDFVDFLREREAEQRLTQAAAKTSEVSFARVWDNDEDAVYDRM
jgi:hypothetical protein